MLKRKNVMKIISDSDNDGQTDSLDFSSSDKPQKAQKFNEDYKQDMEQDACNFQILPEYMNCMVHFSSYCLIENLLENGSIIQACSENPHKCQYVCQSAARQIKNSQCPMCRGKLCSISSNEKQFLKKYYMKCQVCGKQITKQNFSSHMLGQYKNYFHVAKLNHIYNFKTTLTLIPFLDYLEFCVPQYLELEAKPFETHILKLIKKEESIEMAVFSTSEDNIKFNQQPDTDNFAISFHKTPNKLFISVKSTKDTSSNQSQPPTTTNPAAQVLGQPHNSVRQGVAANSLASPIRVVQIPRVDLIIQAVSLPIIVSQPLASENLFSQEQQLSPFPNFQWPTSYQYNNNQPFYPEPMAQLPLMGYIYNGQTEVYQNQSQAQLFNL